MPRLPCNSLNGHYQQDHKSLMTWEVMQSAVLCLEPDGVMEAEEPMTRLVFTEQVEVAMDGKHLTISGSDVAMTFTRLEGS